MKNKLIILAIAGSIALGCGLGYRFAKLDGGGEGKHAAAQHEEETHKGEAHKEESHEEGAGHEAHGEEVEVAMTPEAQKQNGVAVHGAKAERIAGVISATGKVEANADRIAHVSPRISGNIVSVRGSLGDAVGAGQTLVTLDSVELADSLNRYHQSRTKLALAQSNMERVKALVEKKIAARKEILQAETEYKYAQTELHTDGERLALYGVSVSDLQKAGRKKPVLPVASPISGIITEKHAIDLHGTPEYKLLLKIDGKDVPLPATLRQEETEMRRLSDAEVGAGMLYSFYNNVRIPAGRHKIVLAIPADNLVIEREIALAEGSNTLSFEPEYRWAPGKERLRFYGTTSYKEGIKGLTVVLNGKAL